MTMMIRAQARKPKNNTNLFNDFETLELPNAEVGGSKPATSDFESLLYGMLNKCILLMGYWENVSKVC